MMEVENTTNLKRNKRLTSVVWNDFERVKEGDMILAICNHCQKTLNGSSTSGTSHLRNHLKRCRRRPDDDITQQRLVVRKKKIDLRSIEFGSEIGPLLLEHSRPDLKFDQEQSRLNLALMVILHGYELSMVEHVGFQRFVSNLQPSFQFMSCDNVKTDCMQIYEKNKLKVYEIFGRLPGRVSLTSELWTSCQGSRFLCLTAYYINESWQLQRRILNFTLVEPDTEEALYEVIITCLTDWGIDHKLFSVTVDSPNNDNAIFRIKDHLSENRLILHNSKLFHVQCARRVLDSIVEDVLEALHDVAHKIRESVRYVRSSEAIKQKFSELALDLSQKSLSIDCSAQWTSTYFMLEAAVEYREAFSRLQACDPDYLTVLSDTEWERAISLTNYLKLVVEVTNVFSEAKHQTANIYFPEFCDIHLKLIEWCKSTDSCIGSTALKMKSKFDNYWSVSGLTLTVAVVLDPRFKMKLVEYYFCQMFETSAQDCINEVSDGIKELFHEYSTGSTFAENSSELDGLLPAVGMDSKDRLSGYDKFLHETSSSPHMKSELEKYLEEPIFPRNPDFDILNWWKVNSPKYPILSRMARDILGISLSIADSSASVYDMGGRLLDLQRSSLSPDVLEALICARDWLQNEIESELPVNHSNGPLCITST